MWVPERPVYVIEPHADDAYLSLGWHLERWAAADVETHIVTVYSADSRRSGEAIEYARAVGARWHHIGLSETGSATLTAEPVKPEYFDDPVLGAEPGVYRLWPLGAGHPEHAAVAACRPPGELSYLEAPYQAKPSASLETSCRLVGRSVVSYAHPPARKWRHDDLFKTQKLMFYRARVQVRGCHEVIVG